MKRFVDIGIIGRFRPLHLGSARVLRALCLRAGHVNIGIGSSNRYDLRNPFTLAETRQAITCYLNGKADNYRLIDVPDFGHLPAYRDGKKWLQTVTERFGPLDAFVTANDYVKELLAAHYTIIHPVELLAREERIPLRGTMVRTAMALGRDYRRLLPPEVVDIYDGQGRIDAFRKEFGLAILAGLTGEEWFRPSDKNEESRFVRQQP
jgi:nicotinamide-nucleotide adenylyltransferase